MWRRFGFWLLLVLIAVDAAQAGVILTPLDPAMVDDTLHSINSEKPVVIEFVNRYGGPVDIYWIDFRGVRVLYHSGLPVGETWRIITYVTHPWLLVASDTGGTTARGSGRLIAGFEVIASGGTTDRYGVNTAILSDHPLTLPATPHPVQNPRDNQNYLWIPPGRFVMGCSPNDSDCDASEKPPHPEEAAPGFWLGETEVTQAAYEHVTGKNPSAHKGARMPVESLTWSDAADYCGAINGRLPSKEEWEYAVRAGTNSPRYGSLEAIAWYAGNSEGATHPVGGKQPNAFGLYDMLGNVWEWTAGFDTTTGAAAVAGGARNSGAGSVRASSRMMVEPSSQSDDRGFRCALDARVLQQPENAAFRPGDPDRLSSGLPYPVYRSSPPAISAPRIVRQIAPEYSEKARKAKLSGSVILRTVVDANGKVARAVVVRSLGMGLDEKAIESVMRWKFEPALKDGKPVAVIATFEVNFKLL